MIFVRECAALYPVDRITYEQFSALKNPLLRTALINANIQLHLENRQGVEQVLDNWPGNDEGRQALRQFRDNAAQAVQNINLAANYLDDQNDPALQGYYKQAGVYDGIAKTMTAVFLDDDTDAETRKTALSTLLGQGARREQQGDSTLMKQVIAVIGEQMKKGTVLKGTATDSEKINWEDELNREDINNARIRRDMLETTLPFLSALKPQYLSDVYAIVAEAAQKDIHPGVRRTATNALFLMARQDTGLSLLQNIRDVTEQVATSDPNAIVRNNARTLGARLPGGAQP